MKIRNFQNRDAREVSNLIRLALEIVNSRDYPEEVILNLVSMFTPEWIVENAKERDVLIAEEDGIILGTGALSGDFISTVFILPNRHGKGIGTELMNVLEDLGRRRGITEIKLNACITAVAFYEKRGYIKGQKIPSKIYGATFEMKKNIHKDLIGR